MNYLETVNYLFNIAPVFEHIGASAYKEGLDNTYLLDEHFGHPHRKFKSIHIAGTNGKGSCSHTLAAILQNDGYKVGLYTSPHIMDFRERIKINGECISKEYVIEFVNQEKSLFEKIHPSFFEVTTALAFKYFAEQHVDYAIIEVGLGGRLDCTNIITPILSIITNISFDHTNFLGNTLEKIAKEKAGIIKPNIPVIIGETTNETKPVFKTCAESMNAEIIYADENDEIISFTMNEDGGITYNTRSFGIIQGELGGLYQKKNTNTILHAVRFLYNQHIIKNTGSINNGFYNVCRLTGLIGRWQKIGSNPSVICDTGHNVGGWTYISRQLQVQKYNKLHIVFGMVNDKDVDGVMCLLPKNAHYYFTKPQSKRAIPEKDIQRKAMTHGLAGDCYNDVPSAYTAAKKMATPDDMIFIGGSSYIVSDLLLYIRQQHSK
ncbi:bifunctional folylpolyglutamate synthase/dihydrofolate synthase [Leyella lascolaii]|uniref:Dihydrofolate synthase/folylpolyglutamate synthase n=1 Tax=Leyella lascolaii TaxID=1776379 RepID=A0AAW7JI76_9BACT|nr:folylpolyglutamate synthase/dihydrofolate synthase family protein [Leyella lascolaii]MDN0022539.1 folylpolyglutamate synthase/dihydrofolate synthase family protein [Leyella lascolaii]MDN0025464.1 folylpolyglutamate synthase/dihydrofolate synthase family protein [Leyella lascolaii]